MMNRKSKCMLAAAVLAVAADGLAQDQMQSPTIQARHGQSSAQQSRDADRCQVMARKHSGVDPTVLAANSTPLQEGKGLTSTPIDQPTMAMGSSGAAGTTGAGTADMGGQQNQGQMGSSGAAGATGSSGGQMGTSEAGAMGSSGTSGTAGATGAPVTGDQTAGTATSGMNNQAGSSGAMGSTGAQGATGSSGMTGATASATPTTPGTKGEGHAAGKGGGKQQLAMASADDYNTAFSKCMSSRGYTVESGPAGGN